MSTQRQNPHWNPQTTAPRITRLEAFWVGLSGGALAASVGWIILLITFS